jgi:pimeloyl-ACP methyl ester carboxylesterase
MYASRFPTAGIVDVDMVLRIEPFAELVQSLAPQLHSDAFPSLWSRFQDSMHLELIPTPTRALVTETMRVERELVLGYWSPLFTMSPMELATQIDDMLAQVHVAALGIHGDAPEDGYREWLEARCPSVEVKVWPRSGHLPHLVHPSRFAHELTAQIAA